MEEKEIVLSFPEPTLGPSKNFLGKLNLRVLNDKPFGKQVKVKILMTRALGGMAEGYLWDMVGAFLGGMA